MAAHDSALLLVEDDSAFRKVYGSLLRDAGFEVSEAADRNQAKAALAKRSYVVVVLDLMLPPDGSAEGGLAQLAQIISDRPSTKVIIASGVGDTQQMLRAVKAGAHDYLTKPIDPDVLLVVVQRAFAMASLEANVATLRAELSNARPEGSMVGAAPSFLRAISLSERVAASDLPLLLTGENGTGKELLARSIHEKSRRAKNAFVAVNCGALPEQLMESMFFGHVKGSFTGANRDHRGLFVEADGGTLFLDEIGDMVSHLQVKVLRALESGEIMPVGADLPVHVDVRVLSATNKDLLGLQKSGQFREDLYWRINGTEVRLPALRERLEDIPLLAKHFLNLSAHLCPDGHAKILSEEARDILLRHPWPGNLRELRHEMQRATVMAGDRERIEPEDLSMSPGEAPRETPAAGSLQEKIEALERAEISEALRVHNNNRTRAAEMLGLSRQGLLKKLERYGLGS